MDDANLAGMSPDSAREYVLNFISNLKLTEKQIQNLNDEIAKWQFRIELAASKGQRELEAQAQKEMSRLLEKHSSLTAEESQLKQQIEQMRKQLPALASMYRSIDPDLLEQELLMAAGFMPGDEEKVRLEREFSEMEKAGTAAAALEELKTRMRQSTGGVQ